MEKCALKFFKMLEEILYRYNFPRYKRTLDNFNAYSKSLNDLCGDEIEVFLKISDNQVVEISYQSKCCTICQGVVEILIDNIINKKLDEIKFLDTNYLKSLIGEDIIKVRTKCALIGLETIKKAIYEYERNS